MKRYWAIISFITIGYILGWTSSVLRFGLSPLDFRPGPRHPHGPEDMFENINLSPEQRTAIRQLRREEMDQNQGQRQQMETARREFEKLLDSSQDKALLEQAFHRMIESKMAMEKEHFSHMMQVHQILTLDQIKQLGAQRSKHRPPHKDRRGGPDGPPGGPDGPEPMDDRPPPPP